jgi:iron-sulfur cluster repair protein YtfE (RIC family)
MQATTAPIDTSVMPTVHTLFRREIRLAGGVVRRVPDGDVRRAGVVADHLDLVERTLHEHHTAEDELLWPKLLERVPAELAPIVRLMEAQHGQVDALLGEIGEVRPRWAATADPADRERLADLFDQLYVHLAEHLDAEEERLLPIAARAVTQAEWEEMGARARQHQGQAEGLLVLGMTAYEGDPAVVAQMLAQAPAPVRWLVPKLARRAFRRRALVIHGTATP